MAWAQPATAPVVRHLAFPIALSADGSLATVVQDTLDEVAGCVAVIVGTPVGACTTVPDLGVPDQTFAGPDPGAIIAAVSRYEPRAQLSVSVAAPPTRTSQITVAVGLAGAL